MLRIENLEKSIGDRVLFNGFSLSVDQGEKILLSAPSGRGKTTLFRILLGFDRDFSGSITLFGKPLNHTNIDYIRSQTAYLSQDIDLPSLSVRGVFQEILGFNSNKHLVIKQKEKDRLYERLGLDVSIESKNIDDLSGGERQRLGLSIAFLLKRPCLLLDEPLSALDRNRASAVTDLLREYSGTVLAISHDPYFKESGLFREVENL